MEIWTDTDFVLKLSTVWHRSAKWRMVLDMLRMELLPTISTSRNMQLVLMKDLYGGGRGIVEPEGFRAGLELTF